MMLGIGWIFLPAYTSTMHWCCSWRWSYENDLSSYNRSYICGYGQAGCHSRAMSSCHGQVNRTGDRSKADNVRAHHQHQQAHRRDPCQIPPRGSWSRLGIPIFGSNFWDPHRKQNSDSVFDSKDSGRIFFRILLLKNWVIGIPIPKFRIPKKINAGIQYTSSCMWCQSL